MKIFKYLTNGVILIIIALMHTQLVVSPEGCGKQLHKFAETAFFNISNGIAQLPFEAGKTDFETFAAFWFFYWGLFIIPIGLFVHAIEIKYKILPHSFTISYLIFIIMGAYMVPNSGMTFIMLPHATYMLVRNYIKAKRLKAKYSNAE